MVSVALLQYLVRLSTQLIRDRVVTSDYFNMGSLPNLSFFFIVSLPIFPKKVYVYIYSGPILYAQIPSVHYDKCK